MKKIILVFVFLVVYCTFVIENCSAQVWSPMGSGMNGSVGEFTVYNNDLIAGGNFTTAGGVTANRIAKWNGTSWSPLGAGLSGPVYTMTVYNNELIVGGAFEIAGSDSASLIARWNGTNWLPIPGKLVGGGIARGVMALKVFNGELIVGGAFDSVNGIYTNNIAKWNGTSWMPIGNGLGSAGLSSVDNVSSLTVYNNSLIAGGMFYGSGSLYIPNIARWNGTGWENIGSGITGGLVPPTVYELTVFNNEIIAGGNFWVAGGVNSRYIARTGGEIWSTLGTGINGTLENVTRVCVFALYGNDLIVGGQFDTAGGIIVNNITKWNGTTFMNLGNGISGNNIYYTGVSSLIVYNNELIVGGLFTTAGTIPANNIAKWGPAFSVTGQVRYSDNNQPATGGYVKAIKLDKVTGSIITYDSVQIQANGNYTLTNVPQDSVDIGVYPNSTTQNDWVMTYYPSTIYWQNATTIYPAGNLTNINVGVYRLTSTTNNNSVNGKVMRLNDNPLLANLKDAVLYAKSGSTLVRCGISDANGVYHLNSLPVGSLKIIVDRMGFRGDSTNVAVTLTSNIDSVNFVLYGIYVGIRKTGDEIPSDSRLYQNYPNPFNPYSVIKYQLNETKFLTLKVFDVLGKEVAVLVNASQTAGIYEVTFNGSALPSGIYFCRLEAADPSGKKNIYSETKKMLLIK